MRPFLLYATLLLPAACSGSGGSSSPAGLLDRPADGVVLTGGELSTLLGSAPGEVAAFRWSSGWQQVPVQVDERALVPWLQVYGGLQPPWDVGLDADDLVLAWCDPTTFTGADPDPALDLDDEVALDASDAGERAPLDAPLPAGATSDGATEVRLVDPLDGAVGWLYLFRHDGTLDPAAGADRVRYTFELLTGLSYLDGYAILWVPNPELSKVEAPGAYATTFSDRWVREDLVLLTDGAPGVDVLDRHRTGSQPPVCIRNEDTFCGYGFDPSEGAILTNVDGPVRAIRSVAGANSGVLMQRDHVFWPRREDVTLHVRVHPVDFATEDLLNLSPAALGARFHAPWTAEEGVLLDGDPADDPAPPAVAPTWEMITGAIGTWITSHRFEIEDPGAEVLQVFRDDLSPDVAPCTGSAHAIELGWRVPDGMDNTDPRLLSEYGVVYVARSERAHFFEPPDQPRALAELRRAQHVQPLAVDALPFAGGAPASGPPEPPPKPRALATDASGRIVAALRLPGVAGARWSVAEGELPSGVELDPGGVLRGSTGVPGTHRCTLRADHAAGSTRVEVTLDVPLDAAWPALRAWAARWPVIGRWFEE